MGATGGALALMVLLQLAILSTTFAFRRALRYYQGQEFERALKQSRTLQGIFLAGRGSREEQRVSAKALSLYAAESDEKAIVLVDEMGLAVLSTLARVKDDSTQYFTACALNSLAGVDSIHERLIQQGFLEVVVHLTKHKADVVVTEAASAILRFTYRDEDIASLLAASPEIVAVLRAIAMAREGEVQYFAKVAHENVEKFQLTRTSGFAVPVAGI
jgi:hypothetical protein